MRIEIFSVALVLLSMISLADASPEQNPPGEILCFQYVLDLHHPNIDEITDSKVRAALAAIVPKDQESNLPLPIFAHRKAEWDAIRVQDALFDTHLDTVAFKPELPPAEDRFELAASKRWYRLRTLIDPHGPYFVLNGDNRVNIEEENVFASLEDWPNNQLRKSFAAFRIKTYLGVFPRRQAEWSLLETPHGNQYGLLIPKIVSGGVSVKANPASFANSEAAEFLIGHTDLQGYHNHAVNAEGEIGVYDYADAFVPGVSCVACEDSKLAGSRLPPKYPLTYLERLKDLTPEVMTKLVGGVLTEKELQALALRRQIELKDVELRGAAAVFLP